MSSEESPKTEITFIESSLLSAFRAVGYVFNYFNINAVLSLIFRICVTCFQYWLSTTAVLWSAAFIYSMFYYVYIPLVSTTREVYFQFDSRCDTGLRPDCEMPFARIPLTQYPGNGEFLRGQMYRFTIEMTLPESEVNWSQGMFMVRLKLFDAKQRIAVNVAKPSILRYRSPLTRIINTLFYWPLLVTGLMDESQTLTVSLVEDFVEGSYVNVGPVTSATIEIEARDIQISSRTVLKISAHLTGLRYYMYYWPITTACFGIMTTTFFILLVMFISYTRDPNRSECLKNDDLISDEQNNDSYKVYDPNSCDSGLTGDVHNESESDESSTLVIQEIDDIDIISEDSNPVPDSSSVE